METRTQAYLKKKEAVEKGLPIIWVVKSTPEGVEEPRSHQTLEITGPVSWRIEPIEGGGETRIPFFRHILETDKFPYEVDIMEGKTSSHDEGHGSGCGDLWSWTYHCTTSKEEAQVYYEAELARVTEKYLNSIPTSFTKEDLIDFAKFKSSNLMKHADERGFYLGDEKVFQLWVKEKYSK